MKTKPNNRIREVRELKGLSGTKVAEFLDLTPQYYYDLETGRRRLNEDILNKLADFFGISTDYLLGRTKLQIAETTAIYGERVNPYPSNGNLQELPPEAVKELENIVDYIYEKWKGWKPGDPPR